MKVSLPCQMLIDQARYIGSDPVGHCCSNPIAWELPNGVLICNECAEMLKTEPERLTWPPGVLPEQV